MRQQYMEMLCQSPVNSAVRKNIVFQMFTT